MPKLSDYPLDQILAVNTLAEAPQNLQNLPPEQLDELRLLQIRELMHIINGMQGAFNSSDPTTWVYGEEAEAYFADNIWPWHINLLLKLLDEARAGHYQASPDHVPQPPEGELPFPYNVYKEGDLNNK